MSEPPPPPPPKVDGTTVDKSLEPPASDVSSTEKLNIQSLITPLDNMISACTTIEDNMEKMGIKALPKASFIAP